MNDNLADIEERLRATYRAMAATTVLKAESRGDPPPPDHDLALPPEPRRPSRLLAAMATVAVLVAGTIAAVVVTERDRPSETTRVATQPTTTEALKPPDSGVAGSEPTCGSQLPRPVDVPDAYGGPQRVASSVPGQLVVEWTSATGNIVVRWPADPQFQQLVGLTMAPTPDGQPGVASASTIQDVKQTASGSYSRSTVFGLRNVLSECRSLQVDVIDTELSRVDAGMGRLTNRGLRGPSRGARCESMQHPRRGGGAAEARRPSHPRPGSTHSRRCPPGLPGRRLLTPAQPIPGGAAA